MHGAPYSYELISMAASCVTPSTIHTRNNAAFRFFFRYLAQKLLSLFKFDIPDNWDRDYLLYVLYLWGYAVVFETDIFGVIPQMCGLSGYNVYYRPTNAIVANPLIKGVQDLRIGKNCELLRLQPDYMGCIDLIGYYADQLALCAETAQVTLVNSKLAWIYPANNKAEKETFSAMMDKVNEGQPAVMVDKVVAENLAKREFINRDIKGSYIVNDVLDNMRQIEEDFDTVIGIPNYNKKERMITAEIKNTSVGLMVRPLVWKQCLDDSIAKVNDMFGLDISVDWGYPKDDNLNDQRIV